MMKKNLAFHSLALLFVFLTIQGFGQENVLSGDFKLSDSNGQPVSLAKYRDQKAIVVVFTSSHCSWASKYEDRLKSIFQAYQGKGITFIAINSNDSSLSAFDAAARIRQDSPYPFPYLKDADQSVARLFKATKTPEVVVVTPSAGRFLIQYRGKIDDNPLDANSVRNNYLPNALDAILAGKKPTETETQASGCNITWLN